MTVHAYPHLLAQFETNIDRAGELLDVLARALRPVVGSHDFAASCAEAAATALLDAGLVPTLTHRPCTSTPITRLTYEAISWRDHPKLFEPTPLVGAGPFAAVVTPWPLEHHDRPVIPDDWWKPHTTYGVDAAFSRYAESLVDCDSHPGLIVRRVTIETLTAAHWTPNPT
jgi:hypothetical protein